MTSKRTSLDAVFGTAELAPAAIRNRRAKTQVATPPAEKTQREREQGIEAAPKRPSVKQHTAYLPIAVHEQLRKLAFEEDRKIHDYLIEGLDRVFADRGLPAIKDRKENA